MTHFSKLRGAIFDVDDTLFDNFGNPTGVGLHEQSRVLAAHVTGERIGNKILAAFTGAQAQEAFDNASAHSAPAAIWQTLIMVGEVSPDRVAVEPSHPLLQEMLQLKYELHPKIMRAEGREVAGASTFVARLARAGLSSTMAIASTAVRRDIDIVLEMLDLAQYFPEDKIISFERFAHPKPHPEPFNLAFATLDLPESDRSNVIAFEDDPRGIMSAVAAGLFVCAVTTRFTRAELEKLEIAPPMVVESFAEAAQKLQIP